MVSGTRAHAEALIDEVAAVISPMGLTLSREKTKIAHIDDGLDFLGWHIQRHTKRGTEKRYIYTYPSKKAITAITEKVRTLTRQGTNLTLPALLNTINPVLRGWTNCFKPGVSSVSFQYLRAFARQRVMTWLRHKHPKANWSELRRRYCPDGWWPEEGKVKLFNPAAVRTTRYRYRGAAIPTPWTSVQT